MIEKKVYINNKIPGIIAFPEVSSITPSKAVILLHGFASDKNETGCKEAHITLASNLAMQNIISLRFDFSGWGENHSIPQEESTIDTMLKDALDAYRYLKDITGQTVNIGFSGFSLGAAIAILAAHKLYDDCNFLALLSPVGDLPEDFEAFLGTKIYKKLQKCRSAIDIELPWKTIRLGNSFYHSLYYYDIKKALSDLTLPIMCISGNNDFSARHAQRFIQLSPNRESQVIIYKDTDHCFNVFEENTRLYDAIKSISDWITQLS